MALSYKIGLYTSNKEILISDNTGYYSSSNTSGWNSATTDYIFQNGVTTLTSVTITIDSVTISANSTTNTAIFPGGSITNVLTPESLQFTINRTTYPSFDTDFADFSDGVHTITVSIVTGGNTHTATNTFFVYKEIEEEVWDMFHQISTQYYTKKGMNEYMDKCLFAFSMLKGLEYTCRTSLQASDLTQATNQLLALQDFMDYMDLNFK